MDSKRNPYAPPQEEGRKEKPALSSRQHFIVGAAAASFGALAAPRALFNWPRATPLDWFIPIVRNVAIALCALLVVCGLVLMARSFFVKA